MSKAKATAVKATPVKAITATQLQAQKKIVEQIKKDVEEDKAAALKLEESLQGEQQKLKDMLSEFLGGDETSSSASGYTAKIAECTVKALLPKLLEIESAYGNHSVVVVSNEEDHVVGTVGQIEKIDSSDRPLKLSTGDWLYEDDVIRIIWEEPV